MFHRDRTEIAGLASKTDIPHAKMLTIFVEPHLAELRSSMKSPGSWARAQAVAKWAECLPSNDIPNVISEMKFPLTRDSLRKQCRDVTADVLVGYLCTMAWGGQRRNHARYTWDLRLRLKKTLNERLIHLRDGNLSRREAFDLFTGGDEFPHLGVAFFTKLLFFFRREKDAYILDQWTGKSVNLLCGRKIVPFQGNYVSRQTTSEDYEQYCRIIEDLGVELGIPADEAEALLLSEGGKNPAPWRRYVKHNT